MRKPKSPADGLTRRTMIPDLLKEVPQARAVLDRYGLRGCGGPLGPVESIEFFARAHDVPLEQLLGELRQVAAQPREANAAERAVPAPTVAWQTRSIDRFSRAGILVMLTLGVSWGAFLLLRIAAAGRFDGLSVHEVNAHGHAQIFGWVGLFVMGFAYQAFPRFKHTSLAHPRWAYASFWMMLTGLVVRSVAQGFTASWPGLGPIGVAASAVEVAAIGIMLFVVVSTLRSSDRGLEVYDYYILAALGWFFVQAAGGTVYFAATLAAANRQSLLWLIATWQAPLREIQIHGFATLMILGVSQRLFHHFYGFPTPSAARGRVVLPVFNLALLGIICRVGVDGDTRPRVGRTVVRLRRVARRVDRLSGARLEALLATRRDRPQLEVPPHGVCVALRFAGHARASARLPRWFCFRGWRRKATPRRSVSRTPTTVRFATRSR